MFMIAYMKIFCIRKMLQKNKTRQSSQKKRKSLSTAVNNRLILSWFALSKQKSRDQSNFCILPSLMASYDSPHLWALVPVHQAQKVKILWNRDDSDDTSMSNGTLKHELTSIAKAIPFSLPCCSRGGGGKGLWLLHTHKLGWDIQHPQLGQIKVFSNIPPLLKEQKRARQGTGQTKVKKDFISKQALE